MGSETCLPCGANTTVYPGKDGCDTNDCKFTPAEGVEYDLSGLSREDGPMIKALLYRVQPRSRIRYETKKRKNEKRRVSCCASRMSDYIIIVINAILIRV